MDRMKGRVGAPLKPKRRPVFSRVAKATVSEHGATVCEDDSLARARRLCARGRYPDAQALLSRVIEEEPDNPTARKLMLKTCVGLRLPWEVASHADWVIGYYVREEQDSTVCDVYVRLVRSKLDLPWKQGTLVAAALAATRAARGSVIIDAANRLLKLFPTSRALPAILLAAAERQAAKGRRDLARKTLRHIIRSYPDHVDAVRAQQHLQRIPVTRLTSSRTSSG
jgi:tetratricopeptide (TPR) repeat protein